MDPTQWPASSKPYFMVVLDNSGSMNTAVTGAAPSCAGYPSTRVGHARCALANMVKAYAGQVNFGLASYPSELDITPSGTPNAACTDGTKDGNETDVDCGGNQCIRCIPGKACAANGDCASNVCTGNVCQTITCPNNLSNNFAHCAINDLWTGTCTGSCGNNTGGTCASGQTGANQRGADILVPLPADDYWDTPPTSKPNTAALLSYVDNQCGDCKELFSSGNTPLNGVLRDMYRYLSTKWEAPAAGANANTTPAGSPTYSTPLTGTERSCRSVNVILITDGGETCPTDNNAVQAKAAATALATGWTIGATAWTAKTYVVDVGGATPSTGSKAIATGGGTTAVAAQNEVALSQALSGIIAGAVAPEVCDNVDNNCNGCIDEGSRLYCNRNKTAETLAFLQVAANKPNIGMCCSWTTVTPNGGDRAACETAYAASISTTSPQGSRWLLPCWNAATDTTNIPAKWLCVDPGEICDNADNDCDVQIDATKTASFATNTVDEGQTKCGSPAHCPVAETCNGQDDDCDTIIDNASGSGVPYSACPNNCQPSPELCNGCDDDCDGIADNGISPISCGFSPPANCAGTESCPPVAVAVPGGCIPGVTKPGKSQFTACNNSPVADNTCDGLDNNCNGVIDEGAPPTACTNGFPGLVYKDVNPASQCVKGLQACGTTSCVGWTGPSTEVCDGIDNDCDGIVDDNLPAGSTGNACGTTTGICKKGATACVGGVIVCQGGTQPQPETCNGLDDNCNGQTDEAPLSDGPTAPGCWTTAGAACTFVGALNTLTWTPPPGATCSADGSLTAPCQAGSLVCLGATGWACQGSLPPSAEVCDGRDNNCNGTVDDGNPGGGATCGSAVGACTAGVVACVSGKDICQGGTSPTPEICDGIDNDCDGTVDDNVPGLGQTCGSNVGTCKSGVTACVKGAVTCQGQVAPAPEICDGKDNNCDGAIDNTPVDAPANPGCWNIAGTQCSGGGKTWNAPAGGTCTSIGALLAPCSAGTLACSGAAGYVCQGGTLPGTEVCDGVDNNCNGQIDEGNPGGGGTCGTAPNVPPCKPGTLNCVGGQLSCQGEIDPTTEICDGIDNNCNGAIDDGITVGVGAACGSGSGICKKGITACVSGTIQCNGGTQPGVEVCNGLDDDCDGIVDNNLSDGPVTPGCWQNPGTSCTFRNVSWSPPAGATCSAAGSLTTPCKTGTLICAGTTGWACQGGVLPSPEQCDGIDNNCNGSVDDGNPGGGASCGSAVGACKAGTLTCTSGALSCNGAAGPTVEVCDGIDNDCNGVVDDNVPGLGQSCGSNVGTCKAGVTACVAGAVTCQGQVTASPEICDGKDNNCNGQIDESPTDAPSNPGCWQNAGTTCSFGKITWDPPPGGTCTGDGSLSSPCTPGAIVCQNGGWQCEGGKLPGTEVCDGIDNNCDGAIDNGNPGGGAQCGTSNVGQCKFGVLTCAGGQLSCVGEVPPTPELCDGIDNNCNGTVDENAPGSGQPCTGLCSAGTTVCVGGGLICQTSRQPTPEVCNGIDDNCDGLVDNGVLADAPPAGQTGCWNVAGTTCSYESTTWDPPPNATCTGLGTLTSPCQTGQLTCAGAKGWSCVGGTLPATEICDGKDQNCDGVIDDGNPGGGAQCGIQKGVCTFGTQQCVKGVLTCNGTGPSPEVCNGLDDNCDGLVDNGLPIGSACAAPYDTTKYPGDRTQGECRPGTLQCDPSGSGKYICQGGTGPQPELCDGKDNDCDGKIDEAGTAPDGVDGSADPRDTASPARKIGDSCGSSVGSCKPGELGCISGQVQCVGGIGPQPEICDCVDNNCDGTVDNTPAAGSTDPAVCGTGSACVQNGTSCQCASPCSGGEFPCPTGQSCKSLEQSGTTAAQGQYCVSDACGDCGAKTESSNGDFECGPVGTLTKTGATVPLCTCVGGAACHGPCFTTVCQSGSGCVASGGFVGQCRALNDCRFFGCAAGKVCDSGACVDDPCTPNPCTGATPVCKPNSSFTQARCVASCANVACTSTETCVEGSCVSTGCATACTGGNVCIASGTDGGGACGPSRCVPKNGEPPCNDGSYCAPATGSCGDDPCAGVKCPGAQTCSQGECLAPPTQTGSGGAGGLGGTSGSGGSGGATQTDGAVGHDSGAGGAVNTGGSGPRPSGGANAASEPKGVFGLATGGGGCSCELPARGASSRSGLALGILLGAVLITRRRARREGGAP